MQQEEKGLAIISYINVLFIIPLIVAKTSFARFHANQGLVLFILEVILGTVSGVSNFALKIVPFGYIAANIISSAAGVIGLFYMIYGIVNAARGEEKELPIIGGIKLIS